MGSEQTNGAYTLIDMLIPPKGGPGPHSHPTSRKHIMYWTERLCYQQKKKHILPQKAHT